MDLINNLFYRWTIFPSVVNAFYYFFYNSISKLTNHHFKSTGIVTNEFFSIDFPAGILQPPFFGKGRLAWVIVITCYMIVALTLAYLVIGHLIMVEWELWLDTKLLTGLMTMVSNYLSI